MSTRRSVTAAVSLLLAVLMTMLVTAASAAAAPGSPQRPRSLEALVDGIVQRQLDEYRIPGAAVVVVSGGRQVLAKGYGVADIDRGTRVDAGRTGFFMGSDAKVFTAMAVLQQAERGRLDLKADVNRYLTRHKAGFTIKDSYPGRPVTVRDLLTHTAGFDNSIIGRATARPEDAERLGDSLAEHQPPRVRPPGKVSSYDNYGVALAGYLVELAAGEPFAAYVDRHILRPLGMTRTSFAQPHPAAIATARAEGYRPDGKRQVHAQGQYGAWTPTGAAAVTTATDMGRLMLAQLAGGALDGHRVLGETLTRAMQHRQFANDPRLPGIGYILEERGRVGIRMLVKDGDIPGFHDNLALLPDRDTGVYVAYNGDGEDGRASWAGQELVNLVADHTFGTPRRAAAARMGETGKFTGFYRSTRTSHSDLTRAAALTSSVRVTAGPDSTLTTTGPLSRDPDVTEQHWVRIGDGLFQEKGGQERLAFKDGRLFLASDPTVGYERVPWYESPVLHQQLLIGSLGVLLLSVTAWPIAALIARRRGSAAAHAPAGARLARLLAWTTGALLVVATVCFALLVADPNALNQTVFLGDSPMLTLVPVLAKTALATTAAVLVCAVIAWWRRWWGWAARIHYSAVALAAVLFLTVAGNYHLLG
ncbi:serine hydrolase domain-containing protein [Streptomyces lonegramiae]|uniref:Serine hydrolase domain-containing protein n=1 Tax=Streptomyces lonegramiae TaxID=3075524 RepID=A0ABU2XW89_9ACTN|nr:serine hydrolase domain-containing protein [Streptomyces sp. DSM 41529]MDT0550190.1 serine hydrolase domain-containing protein [Streptomyces sp. DSM 41529]